MNKISDSFNVNTFEDIIGHDKLLKNNGLLSNFSNDNYFSFMLVGDPGIGKSTIIKLCANKLNLKSVFYNAANDSKQVLNNIYTGNEKICLIIDEIHSLNIQNQTFLLKLLDENKIVLLASTTENPFVHLIPALRSRIQIIELLKNKELILDSIYNKISKIKTNNKYSIEDIKSLLIYNEYDIRAFLNQIDIIDNNYKINKIDAVLLENIGFNRFKNSSEDNNLLHDLKSALHKSIRGSDPNASLYYLGGLIRNGNIKEIIRRLVIIAYEDIGLANPNLCLRTAIAMNACEKIGLPEAKIIMANIVLELAMSPKSNSAYKAIDDVLKYLDNNPVIEIPTHIKYFNNLDEYKYSKSSYMNPHNFSNHYINQKYLPDNIKLFFYNYDWSNDNETKIIKNYNDFINKSKKE